MRSFIALSILFLMVACKGKKIKPIENKVEPRQSTAYEFPESREAPRADTLALLNAFKKFRQALYNEDWLLLASMSTGNNYFPTSLTGMLQLPPGLPDFLISSPIKKLYKPAIWNAIQTTEPDLSARTNQYALSYLIKHVSNNKKIESMYRFEFVKEQDEFKFLQFESTADWKFIYPPFGNLIWYFPPGNYEENRYGDSVHVSKFTNILYSYVLKSCQEPVLYNYKGSDEIYRFTWLRSFDFPVVFRFQKRGFNFLLTTKILQDRFDEYPAELESTKTVSVSFFKWYNFKHKLTAVDFWKLDLNDKTAQATDGSMWIVEGVKDGKYHVVERWAPEPELRKACLYLLSISNLKIPKRDIY